MTVRQDDSVMRCWWPLLFVFIFLNFNFSIVAQEPLIESSVSSEPVSFELLCETRTFEPGESFWVALRMKIDDQWHAYWKNPGDAGMPLSVEWTVPEGFQVNALQWPYPQRLSQDSIVGFGYTGEVSLLAEIVSPKSFEQQSTIELKADVRWLLCSDTTCLPGSTVARVSLPLEDVHEPEKIERGSFFTHARDQLPQRQEGLSIQKNGTAIQLNVPGNDQIKFTHAYFCPENNEAIDYKAEANLIQKSEGNFTVALKSASADEMHMLQGVLVLSTAENEIRAIDVQDPVSDASLENIISEVEPTSSNFYPKEITEEISPSVTSEFEGGIGLAVLLAFIGGMILNLMPCVLPVISLKIMGFIQMAGESRSESIKHGLAYSVGVIVSFLSLVMLLLGLQAYGRSVGWGFQLQNPLFVSTLASVLLVCGLSMFGVFEIGTSLSSFAGEMQDRSSKKGLSGSFFSGVLATVLATPCLGPFLGSVLGFAFTLPLFPLLLIFTSIGIGMAVPYFILTLFPSLLCFLPKPGPWMGVLKEVMGFFMLATVLWLVWVFSGQTDSAVGVFLLLTGFFLLAVTCWIYGKWGSPIRRRRTRITGMICSGMFLSLAAFVIYHASDSSDLPMSNEIELTTAAVDSNLSDGWIEFSPEKLKQFQAQGIPVFIDFTAKWCWTCQLNHVVLSLNQVNKEFSRQGVVKMKADWTRYDPVITEELRKLGRNGIPLYVLYGKNPKESPKILDQVLLPQTVITELKTISSL